MSATHKLYSIFLILCFALPISGVGQGQVVAYGATKVWQKRAKLTGVRIDVMRNNKKVDEVVTADGSFEIALAYDEEYELRFSKEGYVTKTLVVDTRSIPAQEKQLGEFYTNSMQISMIPDKRCLKTAYLRNNPVGIYRYNATDNDIQLDEDHSIDVIVELGKIERQCEKLNELDGILARGDSWMNKASYGQAYSEYDKAFQLCDADEIVSNKRDSADYRKWVSGADDLFADNKYDAARKQYVHALGHHAWRDYPQRKIDEIDSLDNVVIGVALPDILDVEIQKPDATAIPSVATTSSDAEKTPVDRVANSGPQNKLNQDLAGAHPNNRTGSSTEKYQRIQKLKNEQALASSTRAGLARERRQARQDSLASREASQPNIQSSLELQMVTERTYDEGNKTVVERTVVRGSRAILYKQVTTNYGTFYFRGGVAITVFFWDQETSEK